VIGSIRAKWVKRPLMIYGKLGFDNGFRLSLDIIESEGMTPEALPILIASAGAPGSDAFQLRATPSPAL